MLIDTTNPTVLNRAFADARNSVKTEYEVALFGLQVALKCSRKELLEYMQSGDGKQVLVDWVAQEETQTDEAPV